MTPMEMAALFALVLVAAVVVFWLVSTYNAVVALALRIDKAWANIEVALKQRHDQLPKLVDAVRAAAAGHRHLDRSVASRMAHTALNHRGRRAAGVTDRESEVLRLMALGYSNKEIAATLNLSVKTIEVHKANAMRKLGLAGRTDVVKYALLQGWLRDV